MNDNITQQNMCLLVVVLYEVSKKKIVTFHGWVTKGRWDVRYSREFNT